MEIADTVLKEELRDILVKIAYLEVQKGILPYVPDKYPEDYTLVELLHYALEYYKGDEYDK